MTIMPRIDASMRATVGRQSGDGVHAPWRSRGNGRAGPRGTQVVRLGQVWQRSRLGRGASSCARRLRPGDIGPDIVRTNLAQLAPVIEAQPEDVRQPASPPQQTVVRASSRRSSTPSLTRSKTRRCPGASTARGRPLVETGSQHSRSPGQGGALADLIRGRAGRGARRCSADGGAEPTASCCPRPARRPGPPTSAVAAVDAAVAAGLRPPAG